MLEQKPPPTNRPEVSDWGRRGRVWPLLVVAVVGALALSWLYWSGNTAGPLRSASPGRLEAIRKEAARAAESQRWQESADALEELESRGALSDTDRLLLGRVEMGLGHAEAALAAVRAIPDSSPSAAQAHALAGQVELRRDRMAHAEREFLAAIALDPKIVQPRRELIYVYGMQLRREPIQEQFRALEGLAPLNYDEVFMWCLTRGTTWEATEHIELLRAYVKADPNDKWSRLTLALTLVGQGGIEEAEQLLEPLPDSDPDARAARVRLAIQEGDLPAAERLLTDAPPAHAELARLRGQIALSKRDAPKAVKWYREADRLAPDNRDSVFGLGRALQLAGKHEEAQPYLERAGRLDQLATLVQRASSKASRDDVNLMLQLGGACVAVGRVPEARAWYRLAIDRDPLNAVAQRELFRLRREEPADVKPNAGGGPAKSAIDTPESAPETGRGR